MRNTAFASPATAQPRVIINAHELTARILGGLLRDVNQHFGLSTASGVPAVLAANTLHLIFLAESTLFPRGEEARMGLVSSAEAEARAALQKALLQLAATLGITRSDDFGALQGAVDGDVPPG